MAVVVLVPLAPATTVVVLVPLAKRVDVAAAAIVIRATSCTKSVRAETEIQSTEHTNAS